MGQLDQVFRDTAPILIALFVDKLSTFRRVRQVYGPLTGTDVPVTDAEVEVRLTPPEPYNIREIDGDSVLTQDLKAFAAALTLDDLEFDPIPTSEVTISIQTRGRVYKAVTVKPVISGDEVALYEFQLRL